MAIRSWLFVPGDSEKKLVKAPAASADVLILDLEDSVVPASKPIAREMVRRWLVAHRQPQPFGRWVRINALDTPYWRDDLVAVMAGAPDGIMLPKSDGPQSVQQVAAELYELEGRSGVAPGSTRILPLVSETAAAALSIPSYAGTPIPRLAGLTWGAEDLSAAIGATRKRHDDGTWTDAFRFVRSQTVLTAHACGVAAIDTLHADFSDLEGLRISAQAARADGFAGMLAIHPAQVKVINEAFSASATDIAEAQEIVAAFDANPHVGALQINGKMIDRPHYLLARRILAEIQPN